MSRCHGTSFVQVPLYQHLRERGISAHLGIQGKKHVTRRVLGTEPTKIMRLFLVPPTSPTFSGENEVEEAGRACVYSEAYEEFDDTAKPRHCRRAQLTADEARGPKSVYIALAIRRSDGSGRSSSGRVRAITDSTPSSTSSGENASVAMISIG